MPGLSVIMITNNEAENLPRALASVAFADEIVICDSNSSDDTVRIARAHGARVIVREFTGFGAAKQAALEQATGEWVFSLDADEEVDGTLQREIVQAVYSTEFDAYEVNRSSNYLGRWLRHSGWYPDWVLRLFRRERGRFSENKVHEAIVVDGSIGRLGGHLLHYTDPHIEHYVSKLNRYTSLSAQDLSERGRRFRVSDLFLKPPAIFIKIYLLKQGFRDGIQGLLLAVLSSFHVFCKYAKLWEVERN
jgi:glycosyltransferase involved in cell wall biosynthesis